MAIPIDELKTNELKTNGDYARMQRLSQFGKMMIQQRIGEKRIRTARARLGEIARTHMFASAEELQERIQNAWKATVDIAITTEDIDKELDKLHIL